MKLTQAQLAKYMDHTMLKPNATQAMIDQCIDEAIKYNTASVCINPYWVKHTADRLKDTDVNTCTVIGFPLGASTTKIKVAEAVDAIENGAVAVIYESEGFSWNPEWKIPHLGISGLKASAGPIADAYYGSPAKSMLVIAVTGTNGKTSSTQWIGQSLSKSGKIAFISTV